MAGARPTSGRRRAPLDLAFDAGARRGDGGEASNRTIVQLEGTCPHVPDDPGERAPLADSRAEERMKAQYHTATNVDGYIADPDNSLEVAAPGSWRSRVQGDPQQDIAQVGPATG